MDDTTDPLPDGNWLKVESIGPGWINLLILPHLHAFSDDWPYLWGITPFTGVETIERIKPDLYRIGGAPGQTYLIQAAQGGSRASITVTMGERLREAKRELRRWCQHIEVHFDPEPGTCEACWDGCERCGEAAIKSRRWYYVHTPRLRRMLVCSVCEQGYFKRAEFEAHECSDAD